MATGISQFDIWTQCLIRRCLITPLKVPIACQFTDCKPDNCVQWTSFRVLWNKSTFSCKPEKVCLFQQKITKTFVAVYDTGQLLIWLLTCSWYSSFGVSCILSQSMRKVSNLQCKLTPQTLNPNECPQRKGKTEHKKWVSRKTLIWQITETFQGRCRYSIFSNSVVLVVVWSLKTLFRLKLEDRVRCLVQSNAYCSLEHKLTNLLPNQWMV